MLLNTGVFNVSVLSRTAEFPLYERFGFQSGREVDKFADYTAYKNARTACPISQKALTHTLRESYSDRGSGISYYVHRRSDGDGSIK